MTESPNQTIMTRDLTIAGFLDSATGRSRGGDYAAIATVGRDAQGYLYVLDIWMRRAGPTQQIQALFDLHEKWNYWLVGIETNCFQELLLLPIEEERKRRAAARPGTRWQLPIQTVHHTQAKETRIATLEPLIANGWLLFADDLPQEFWHQLEAFPRGRHDDAPDALEGAVKLLRTMEGQVARGKPRATARAARNF